MRKEIVWRATRISAAMTVGVLFFPYLENIVKEYLGQTNFFYDTLLSISLAITSLVLYLLLRTIPFFKKIDKNGVLEDYMDAIFSVILYTLFVITGLKILDPFWVCIALIGLEFFTVLHMWLANSEELT